MKMFRYKSWIVLLVVLLTPTIVFGQNAEAICRVFLNQTFSDLSDNCAGLESNEICYGYGEVTTTFNVDGEPLIPADEYGQLEEAGDQFALVNEDDNATVENISGVPFVAPDTPNGDGEWAIAIANVQANLPQQLDSDGANYIMFGDTQIENGVSTEDAFLIEEVIEVTVENANIFNKPPAYDFDGYASEVVDTVSGTFEADAISPDGQWVRVFFTYERTFGERSTAWLETATLTNEPDLSVLAELGANDFAPLQSFYISGNSSVPECDNAVANGLLIQGPEETETDFQINGVSVRLTSTAFIDLLGPRSLRISILGGVGQINPGFDDEVVVTVGQEAIICLTEDAFDLGIDDNADNREYDPECGVEGPFVFGTNGSSVSNGVVQRFTALSNLPNNLTNYRVPTITIVRPSGVGAPEVNIIINPPEQARRIRDLCDDGTITGEICDLLQ